MSKAIYTTVYFSHEGSCTADLPGLGTVELRTLRFKIDWRDMPLWRKAATIVGLRRFTWYEWELQLCVRPDPPRPASQDEWAT